MWDNYHVSTIKPNPNDVDLDKYRSPCGFQHQQISQRQHIIPGHDKVLHD